MNNKQRLNLSIVNNLGYRVNPNLILGEYNGYTSGDILDANAVMDVIKNIGSVSELLSRIKRLELILDKILEGSTEDLDQFKEVATQLSQKASSENVYSKVEVNNIILQLDVMNDATDEDVHNLF